MEIEDHSRRRHHTRNYKLLLLKGTSQKAHKRPTVHMSKTKPSIYFIQQWRLCIISQTLALGNNYKVIKLNLK